MDDATIDVQEADPIVAVRLLSYSISSGEEGGRLPFAEIVFGWFRQGGAIAYFDRLRVEDGSTPETKFLSGTGANDQVQGLVVAIDTPLANEAGGVLTRLRRRITTWAKTHWETIGGVDRFTGTTLT